MNNHMKKSIKIAGAACAATGVVALSSLVACGAAVGAIVEGFSKASDKFVEKFSAKEGETIEEAKKRL